MGTNGTQRVVSEQSPNPLPHLPRSYAFVPVGRAGFSHYLTIRIPLK